MPSHFEEKLQKDIDGVRRKIIQMGELAEQAVSDSIEALKSGDMGIAYGVILRDRYIDEMETELDRACQEFLLRQQPAAGHLRFIYAAIQINNELERIGDYAESIARQILELNSHGVKPSYEKFIEIADRAIPMLRNAIQAFSDRDPELARGTREMEKQVDDLRHDIHNEILVMRDKRKLPSEAVPPLMIIASRYERVADRACNICEEVLYMLTGQSIKHEGKDVVKVLFVDEHDSCRGPLAEGIANSMIDNGEIVFTSAGISPTSMDPQTVKFLAEKGIDISDQTSKYLHQMLAIDSYSVIVALCAAAEKAFPPPPTKTVSIRWDVQDISKLQGTDEELKAAYEKAYEYLSQNISNLIRAIQGNHS